MRSASGPAAGLRDLAGPGLGGLVADLFDDELDAVASRLDEAGLLARADSGADRGGSSQCGDGSHGAKEGVDQQGHMARPAVSEFRT
jgi:hypothetical protein